MKNSALFVLCALLTACGGSDDNKKKTEQPIQSYTISTNVQGEGQLNPTSLVLKQGESGTFELQSAQGYQVANVEGCNGKYSNNKYTIESATQSCQVTAIFEAKTINLTLESDAYITLSADKTDYVYGDSAVINYELSSGYLLDEITGCDGVLDDGVYKVDTLTADCKVNATTLPTSQQFNGEDAAKINVTVLDGKGSILPSSKGIIDPSTPELPALNSVLEFERDLLAVDIATEAGQTIELQITYENPLPTQFTYQKLIEQQWQALDQENVTVSDDGLTLTLTLTDGGAGDSDGVINGVIKDPGGPAVIRMHSVTVNQSIGGVITPESLAVAHGDTALFTITSDTGYSIESVTGCTGTLNGTSYQTAAITQNCEISAEFSLRSFLVTAQAGEGGQISPLEQMATYGETLTFTVTADDGHNIESVEGCNGSLAGNIYTTGMITAECEVRATFDPQTVLVTAQAGVGGSISPMSQEINVGQTTTLTVSANAGYSIANVTGCKGTLNGNTYTTGAVTSNCQVQASFSIDSYTVNASAGEGGTVNPATQNVNHGSSAQITITPNEGYSIDAVTGCSGSLNGSTYTTSAVTANCQVQASFSIDSYTVNASAGEGGTVNPATQSVNHGSSAQVTITPNEGYSIDAVTGCSGSLSGNTYTTIAVTANCQVQASFSINNYTVSATASESGTVNPATQSANHGSSAQITITANEGYSIDAVTGCSGSLIGNTYTTGAVTANCQVQASFSVDSYTVSATADEGGTVNPATQNVNQGSNAQITITPNEGYSIDAVTGCNGSLNGNTYTTGAVTANCQVQASFSSDSYSVAGNVSFAGAKVKLLKLPEMTLIAESVTSSKQENVGMFSFQELALPADNYYLLEVSGGKEIDSNLDGIIVDEEIVDVKGKIRAIVSATDLIEQETQVTALSDLLYLQVEDTLSATSISNIYSKTLPNLATQLIQDINLDGQVDYKDILYFNPYTSSNKLNIDYKDIRDFYIPTIYQNLTKVEQLRSLLHIFDYQIDLNTQNYQIIPFSFSASLPDIPDSISVQWQVNNKVHDFEEPYTETDAGLTSVTAELSHQGEVIGQLSQVIHAAEVELVASAQTSESDTVFFNLAESFGLGAGVTVPAGASSKNLTIEVNKVVDGTAAIDNLQVSDTIVFYPAGTVFKKPVTVALPYYSNTAPENLRVVRYSDSGDKDYLNASHVDTENKLIYFETQHFTSFTVESICLRDSCEKLKKNLDKVKELLANHYSGPIDYEGWDDDMWEDILNSCINDDSCETNVYDQFLKLNNLLTLVQVLDGTYTDDDHPDGIKEDFKYLTAYKYLYKNDSTIEASMNRWNDIKAGLNVIQAYRGGIGVSIETDGARQIATASLQAMTASLGMFDFPPSSTNALNVLSTIDFSDGGINQYGIPISPSEAAKQILSWLNVPVYNPVELGGMLIKGANDIAFNNQIKTYILNREGLGISDRATLDDFEKDLGFISGSGKKRWFAIGSYSSISDINSKAFFNNVEDMYQFYSNYKEMHADTYGFKNTCGDIYETCENSNLFKLTPEASFAALMMTTYKKIKLKDEQEYREKNPSFSINTYQIDRGAIQEFDQSRGFILQGDKGREVTLTLTFDLQGSQEYIDEFDPTLNMKALPCKRFELCDDLGGLTFKTVTYSNSEDSRVVDIDFKFPEEANTYFYKMELSYQSLFAGLEEELSITVNEEHENKPPSVEILTPSNLAFTSGESFYLEANADDVDGTINDYQWIAYLENELLPIKSGARTNKATFEAPNVASTQTMLVYLNVTDDGGKLTTAKQQIIINPQDKTAPIAVAGDDQVITSGEYYELDGSQSTDETDKQYQLSYSWLRIDSHDGIFNESCQFVSKGVAGCYAIDTNKKITFTYQLTVTDSQGNSGTDSVNITVVPKAGAIIVNAGPDQFAWANTKVTLDGSASYATDNKDGALKFNWSQIGIYTTTLKIYDADTAKPSFYAPNVAVPTEFTIKLEVEDEKQRRDIDTIKVTIGPAEGDFKPVFLSINPKQVVAGTSAVTFKVIGRHFPQTLAMALEDSSSCSEVQVFSGHYSAEITCAIPSTNKTQLAFYIKEAAGGAIISGAEELKLEVTQANAPKAEFSSISPQQVVAGTSAVTFTVTGKHFPETLAMALEDSDSCSAMQVVNSELANITCGIPNTAKTQLAFYIKETTGGTIISGAEALKLDVRTVSAHSFIQPCKECGYSGPYDRDWHGDNTSHLAKDYPAFVGDNVVAIARGQVIKVLSSAAGFGGTNPSLPGGAIVIMHTKDNGDNFYALYGHVGAINSLVTGDIVGPGEVIGKVESYYVGTDDGIEDWPHLHFGIWDAESDFPTSQLGYGPDRHFVDPVPFLVDNYPERLTEVTGLTPLSAIKGENTTFTLSGEHLPNSIAMSLAGSESCSSVYEVTSTQVKIDCIANITGLQRFYIKNKSGGIFLRGSEDISVDVRNTINDNNVLGIEFADTHFAQCVQAHVDAQQVTRLADLTTLNCSNKGIASVTELSHMTGLTSLNLANNNLATINLDDNLALNSADLRGNQFDQATLDYLAAITRITDLKYLNTPPPTTATGKLNDTGITRCADGNNNKLDCPVTDYEGQDAEYGRDAQAKAGTLEKVGGGNAGFDFTKLDANGNDLPESATAWSCVRDNHTGLIWEVKTDDGGLHDKKDRYNWYNPDSNNNGGHPGYQNDDGDICYGYDANNEASYCNTHAYVERVNTQSLCGASDWRLPTRLELMGIVDNGTYYPAIDTRYFPQIQPHSFWSSSPDADYSDYAWCVSFSNGYVYGGPKSSGSHVRLVRARH